MSTYLLQDGNRIVANQAFIDAHFPGAELLSEPETPLTQTSARITRLAFRNRFTQAEKVALELAALDNPSATMAQRQQAAALRAQYPISIDAAGGVIAGGGGGGGWGANGGGIGNAAGGAAVVGNSNITWINTGTRYGAIT